MTTATIDRPTAAQRAKQACRAGYALSENRYCPGLYEVRKPDGTVYLVDLERETCNCPAQTPDCKHMALVQICRRYWLRLERKAAEVKKPRRRLFSAGHIAKMRGGVVPAEVPATGYGSAEYVKRMSEDFC